MVGYIREQEVNRILMDRWPTINIMLKSTMNGLGITIEGLSKSQTMIQEFNLKGQRTINMIRVKLTMGDSSKSFIFYVIDAKTSYKLLLEWPWIHEHGIVAFTLHQCPKYYPSEERKTNGNVKPFTKAESYFTNARFCKENDAPKETMPSTFCHGQR